ncbi:H(+)/Cl(-) exchange transporter 7-like isoform X1 [Daphnia pulicaria]|uniref:H(+)/Cl(-) exchange transporter 7-like isoform X1 n=1 Tax=Daphnia pulicaria TaxID=35523 RepID=UPI001EEB7BCD|nr:H(+)/Cl(-) exchange transporter 7-like isoform X1 [Daphnia pulicaria]
MDTETQTLLNDQHSKPNQGLSLTNAENGVSFDPSQFQPRVRDRHISYGSINGAVPLPENNRDPEMPGQQAVVFRRLPQGMLSTLSSEFESLDYELCENKIFKEEESKKSPGSITKQNATRWVVVFFIGVCTALIACTIDICVVEMTKIKYGFLKKYIEKCVKENCLYIPYLQWLGISCGFAFLASVLVTYGEPVAAGSGIPLVKCYLNGINVHRLHRLKTLFVKAAGVTCSVLGGLAVGKEGPMVHSGAAVAAGLSQGKSTSLGFDFGILKAFRCDQEKRDFVTGGAAAGVAAAFGAPIGGVLFSLEEGSSFWNQNITWRIFFCSMVSAFTLNVVLSTYHGQLGILAYDGLLNFGKFPDIPFALLELPIFIAMGIIGGLSGALFNQMNYHISVFRRRFILSRWAKVLEVIVVCSVTVSVGFIMIYYVDDCKPLGAKDAVEFPIQMFCEDGQFNAVAAMWLQTPEASVRALFHDQPGTHNPLSVGLFFITYFFLACWTYGLSISSGIFIPALLSGAAWGRLVGLGLYRITQGAAWADPGKYALIGAASQLGGIARVTLSLAVILIETTGNLSLGLGLMLTLLTAKFVGDFFNAGIYDMNVQLAGLPMLPWSAPPMCHGTQAQYIMSKPVVVLKEVERVSTVISVLEDTRHQGFPVIFEDRFSGSQAKQTSFGVLRGLILRSQLKILLKEKPFCSSPTGSTRPPISLETFRMYYPRYPASEDIHFTEEERASYLDLRPYMNPTPYTVPKHASLHRTFQLFRALGLRHLIVTDDNNEVAGMITRKTLARYRARICCGAIDFVELPLGGHGVPP